MLIPDRRSAVGGLSGSLIGPRGVGGVGDPSHLLWSKDCSPAYQRTSDQSRSLSPPRWRECQGSAWGSQGWSEGSAVCSKLNAPKLGVRQRAEGRSLSWQRAEPAPVCRDMPKLACRGIPKLVCEGVRAVGHKPGGEEPTSRAGLVEGGRSIWSTILAQEGTHFSIPGMDLKGKGPRVGKGRRKGRAKRVARREANKLESQMCGTKGDCKQCQCKGLGEKLELHCTCHCFLLKGLDGFVETDGEQVWFLTTDEQMQGVQELPVVDAFVDTDLPCLTARELKRVKEGQKGEMSRKLRLWLGPEGPPDEAGALGLSAKELTILGQLSLFKINLQGIIFRIFVNIDGEAKPLWFMEGPILDEIILEIHSETGHGSGGVIFEVLKNKIFTPNLKGVIQNSLKMCATCLEYNIHRPAKENQSTLLPTQSRRVLQMDLLGPLPVSSGFKYIWAGVDGWDRRCYLRGLKSTSGQEMGQMLSKFFAEEGLWENVIIDGQCLTMQGLDKKLMDFLKVGIRRSNYSSRKQGTVLSRKYVIGHLL